MLENLYDDIGSKIKNLAKWIFVGETISAIIVGIVMLTNTKVVDDLLGIIIIVLGTVIAWISSWSFYAFGQLVEDVHDIKNQNSKICNEEKLTIETKEKTKTTISKKTTSSNTSKINSNNTNDFLKTGQEKTQKMLPCPYCGEDLVVMGWDENDLSEKQTCPLCGKEILFNK